MKNFVVVLENIRSAYNVGAIMRTVDALGPSNYSLMLVGYTPMIDNPKVQKTALGAQESVQVDHFPKIEDAISILRKEEYKIFSVELAPQADNYTVQKYSAPAAFVFGNEVRGVSDYAITHSDNAIAIPMSGIKESLNVATTVGIVMFEVNRQIYHS